jgi:LmbE family N-acetylglucosaminyl deacetylase
MSELDPQSSVRVKPIEQIDEPTLLVSTHLDDAALSCSYFIKQNPDITVVTALAGAPDRYTINDWNSQTTGKVFAPDAIELRRQEDAAAMRYLGAKAIWLDFWDAIYLDGDNGSQHQLLSAALSDIIIAQQPKTLLVPLGVYHSDHIDVANACKSLIGSVPTSYIYLDLAYGIAYPYLVNDRLQQLQAEGFTLEATDLSTPTGNIKEQAFAYYSSQYHITKDGFNNNNLAYDESLVIPERFWKVTIK